MSTGSVSDVCCPFCGLLCDDLSLACEGGRVTLADGVCERAARGYAAASVAPAASPRVAGREVSLEQALAEAARLLRYARLPLFGGLASDVAGVRAAVSLAGRCRGVLDHAHGPALRRNLRVLQESGWFSTTLAEIRARADLVVAAGRDLCGRFPRLAERVLRSPPMLEEGGEGHRRVVLLGPVEGLPGSLQGIDARVVPVAMENLAEVAGALRALVRGTPLEATRVAGVEMAVLRELAEQLAAARYSVIARAAGDLDLPHADLAGEHLVGISRTLNRDTRSAVLPLGGTQGDVTAMQVCTWQSGFPLHVDFQRGAPRHDPLRNDGARLLASGEADLLVWVACHTPELLPPAHAGATVIVGHAGMQPAAEPAVFIPAGVPGIDHGGHLFRGDGVVSLPLRVLRDVGLLPAGAILRRIERALTEVAA